MFSFNKHFAAQFKQKLPNMAAVKPPKEHAVKIMIKNLHVSGIK